MEPKDQSILKQQVNGTLIYNGKVKASSLTIQYDNDKEAIRQAYKDNTWA
jgi:hypothetical protein